jgi:predicted RNA-binding protein with PIN domain
VRYLIDGYNLLHAIGLLHGRAGPHALQKARLALLGRLCGTHGTAVTSVTVVFDASGAPPGAVPEEDYQGLRVRYSLQGEADDLIEDLIRREPSPRQLTVISDDHRIQQAARRRGCPALGCMAYLDEMERPRRPRPTPPAEPPAKPDGVSREEAELWRREFADLIDDPKLREALGPDFRDTDRTEE